MGEEMFCGMLVSDSTELGTPVTHCPAAAGGGHWCRCVDLFPDGRNEISRRFESRHGVLEVGRHFLPTRISQSRWPCRGHLLMLLDRFFQGGLL